MITCRCCDMTKPRINIHIPTDLYARLCEDTRGSGVTKTAIIEAALRAYYNPESRLGLEERVLDRLNSFDVRQGEIELGVTTCLETLNQYVLYWLTLMEPPQEGERDAAQALGKRRFEHFKAQVNETVITKI